MTTNDIVIALRKEASKNKVFNDVCTVFGSRERTRFEVTVTGLMLRMKREGFEHPDAKTEYENILKFLANLNIGKLDRSSTGKIRGLKEVKMTLQSIGRAALGESGRLLNFRKKHTFRDLVPPSSTTPIAAPTYVPNNVVAQLEHMPMGLPISIVVRINGKRMELPVPKDFTAEEVGALVVKFK